MSREVIAAAIRGAHGFVEEAEAKLAEAVQAKGEDQKVEFPDTAFYLPMVYALMGLEVKTVADLKPVLARCRELLPAEPAKELWLPYLGDGLDAGIATLLALETTCALRYMNGEPVEEGCTGFISDTIQRELGIQLVDGRMPGFAAILGPAPANEIALHTVRELQKRSILTFLLCGRNGTSMKDQLIAEGVELGWDTYIVPVGRDTQSAIYVLNWAVRAALTFGGHKKGEWKKCLDYTRARTFAFGITFGPIPDDWYAVGAGAIVMGFPVISDHESTPEVRPTGVTTYEALVRQTDPDQIVPTCIEVRGVKVKVEEIDIPVSYSPAFEGERVRREDMHVQFGGKYSRAVELLESAELDEVNDGDVTVKGKDFDQVEEGGAVDLAIHVRVAGRKMKSDFEGILERQIHRYCNEAMGFMHTGQRHQIWCRFSKEAVKAGFRLKHIGTILHAKLHDEYGGIVDKVAVTVTTEPEEVTALIDHAKPIWTARDERVAGMTDESVDTFYSCTLCQSFAPNHVCIITPERLGLCGAYNWLDGQAAYEINPTGCNQPVPKGKCIDPVLGEWENVNKFVHEHSNGSVDRFSAYSLMQNPMTSCGCFECILAIVPEANGVMIVNREYPGDTPIGMPFSTLAGSVGGGAQTPGFVGVGRLYLASRKFISAEGGLPRLTWMPKELKEYMRERLEKRAKVIGMEGLVDKIADETIATTSEQLLEHLTKVDHPALKMDPLL
ncbi:MAG: bifunctional acetyl-CoA decarbonylase/synthase complex subunit alpha/beta [Phycisphaerae bacterium SM23_33]|nr:MAG: bifunctional acetyl-CoA decarbonylase/synthase complex subunit alpha/beta [Phycisphaerae bacterium SM23_33]